MVREIRKELVDESLYQREVFTLTDGEHMAELLGRR